MSTADKSRIRKYLLGALPEPDRSALEEQYFADDALFEEVCEMEDDLIREYLAGSLTAADRGQFERHLAQTPALRTKVAEVRAMVEDLKARLPSPVPETVMSGRETWSARLANLLGVGPRLAWGAAAASLLVAIVAGAVSLRTSGEITELRAQLQELRIRSVGNVATIILAAGSTRGGAAVKRVPLDANATVFELELKDVQATGGTVHRAVLRTVSGEEICVQRIMSVAGRPLTMAVPASSLESGQEYNVAVTELKENGRTYTFGLLTSR
jgi:anti-sigma factor RsiW